MGKPEELLNPARWRTVAFPATASTQQWMQAAALDLDGQHGPDLVLAAKEAGATLGWLQAPEQPSDLADWQFHALRPVGWVMSLIPHDLDGDGDFDIVFSDRKGNRAGVFWLENPGASANRQHAPWKEHAIGALGRQVMFAELGDVNADGLPDVAVAVKPAEIHLCLQRPVGIWQEQVIRLEAANLGDAKAVQIADVNRDGFPDMLFNCENATGKREGMVWLEQRARGPWLQHRLGGAAGLKYDLMQALDLDGDGDLDVLTCEERDQLGVVWYENPVLGTVSGPR
jgi:hypothetical protein